MKKQWDELPPIFVTSAEKNTGKNAILTFISNLNDEAQLTFKPTKA
jgi:hypothetical protein